MRVIERDGLAVEPGGMVCLHAGYADLPLHYGCVDAELAHNRCAVLNGRSRRLLQWMTDTGLAVPIADIFSVEAFPATDQICRCAAAPLHEHFLFKLGVHLGEPPDAAGALAASRRPFPLHGHRAGPAFFRRDRFPRHTDSHCLRSTFHGQATVAL